MFNQGKFICVEGPDGVGKSTAVQFLADYVRYYLGAEVITLRLPGGTVQGEAIRKLFKQNAQTLSIYEQIDMLVTAKRYALNEVVKPALERGCYVITDRFTDSLYAYQWAGFSNFSNEIHDCISDTLLMGGIDVFPDLKIVMNCDPEIAEARMRFSHRQLDDLDLANNAFKLRVRCYYDEYVKESPRGTTVFLNAGRSLATVQTDLSGVLKHALGFSFQYSSTP